MRTGPTTPIGGASQERERLEFLSGGEPGSVSDGRTHKHLGRACVLPSLTLLARPFFRDKGADKRAGYRVGGTRSPRRCAGIRPSKESSIPSKRFGSVPVFCVSGCGQKGGTEGQGKEVEPPPGLGILRRKSNTCSALACSQNIRTPETQIHDASMEALSTAPLPIGHPAFLNAEYCICSFRVTK